MKNKGTLTKILATGGTLLVWFPIQATLLISAVAYVQSGVSHIDYFMPAELFAVALVGGGLLIWAALRARAQRKIIGWSLGIAAAALVIGGVLASATGLASGAAEPVGIWWALVLAMLAVYSLALVIAGVGGVLLLLDLFRPDDSPTGSA